MLAPIAWRVPPRRYGPWELVTSLLTEGLVAKGVEVTLFATGDSVTEARLESVVPRSYSEDPELDAKVGECLHVAHCFERSEDFDVIHNQFDFLPLTYSELVSTPLVTTIHGFSSERIVPVYERYNDSNHYVAISESDRHPKLDYAATIHHGIRVDEFPFVESPDDYLLFYGRIHPDKGAAEAIEVAKRSGRRLIMAGLIQDIAYHEERVAPHVDGDRVEFLGEVGPDRRGELLGRASGLLHLINFDEPFGLSVVEAMACGTPVIAIERGSMPELIADGETGCLVRSVDEAVSAVGRLEDLNRERVREVARERWSVERMVDDYLRVYAEIV
ncbi:MAG: glycosyltransferase family 4 protein [Chthoniobacterales bacterium]